MTVVDLAHGSLDLAALDHIDVLELRAEAVDVDTLAAALASLRGARSLETLCLISSVRALPPAITELRGLKHLALRDKELPGLPTGIGALTRLRSLRLELFHLGSLPRSIAKLTRLRELYVDSHHLCGLPDGLRALTELRSLTLLLRHHYVHDWQRPAHFNPRFEQPLAELFTILAALPALSSLTLGEPFEGTSSAPIFAELPRELEGLRALETLTLVDTWHEITLPPGVVMPSVRQIVANLTRLDAEFQATFPNATLLRKRLVPSTQ